MNEIIAFLKDDTYPYGYWPKKVGKTSRGAVMAILKRAADFLLNIIHGGYVANQLKGAVHVV